MPAAALHGPILGPIHSLFHLAKSPHSCKIFGAESVILRRREFIGFVGSGLAVALPPAVNAQSPKVYRVGLAFTTSAISEMAGPDPAVPSARAFVHGLRDLGYVEGENLIVERRTAEGHPERYHDILAELVRSNVDVMVTVSTPMIREARAITTTVPIVMGPARSMFSIWDSSTV